jgi:hypothetical protein
MPSSPSVKGRAVLAFASSAPYALFSSTITCSSWFLCFSCRAVLLSFTKGQYYLHYTSLTAKRVTDVAVRLRGPQGPGRVRQDRRRRRPLRAPPHRALRLRRVELRVSSLPSSLITFTSVVVVARRSDRTDKGKSS